MNKDAGYVKRDYRSLHDARDLKYFNIQIRESDLSIGVDAASYSDGLVARVRRELARIRGELEDYIEAHPRFRTSFLPVDIRAEAPLIVRRMAQASRATGVGPMAAVAGAIAEMLGEYLHDAVGNVIVENGGDIYLNSTRPRTIAIFAGQSKFTYRIGIRVPVEEMPLGLCTSSGTVGPSISLGQADAVVIKADNTALADAAATRVGNQVKSADDLIRAIDSAKNISGVRGIVVVKGDKLAAWGEMEIIPIDK